MSAFKIVTFVGIVCSLIYPVYPQQLDPAFKPFASYSGGSVLDFEKQPDGRILIAGDFQTFDTTLQPFLVRINSDGTIDPSFNLEGGFDHYIFDIALQPDGKILVAGYFTTFNGTPAKHLIRLHADGSRDNTFSIGGGFDFAPNAITLQADGKILVTGPFVFIDGLPQKYIVRLNADGTPDNSLDSNALNISGGVPSIVKVQDDGKIILAGNFTTVNGTGRSGICRLNDDGTLDNTFIATGPNDAGSYISDVEVLSSGKILVSGNFTTFNGVSKQRIVRLDTDGSVDNTFVASADALVEQLEIMPDNSISVSGFFRNINSQITGSYARLTEAATLNFTR
jgi:uncharacterized delta-60 repeat protein